MFVLLETILYVTQDKLASIAKMTNDCILTVILSLHNIVKLASYQNLLPVIHYLLGSLIRNHTQMLELRARVFALLCHLGIRQAIWLPRNPSNITRMRKNHKPISKTSCLISKRPRRSVNLNAGFHTFAIRSMFQQRDVYAEALFWRIRFMSSWPRVRLAELFTTPKKNSFINVLRSGLAIRQLHLFIYNPSGNHYWR